MVLWCHNTLMCALVRNNITKPPTCARVFPETALSPPLLQCPHSTYHVCEKQVIFFFLFCFEMTDFVFERHRP
jgi:hypothetical protein